MCLKHASVEFIFRIQLYSVGNHCTWLSVVSMQDWMDDFFFVSNSISSFFSCWKIYWIISSLLSRIFPSFSQHTRTLFLCSGNFPILQFFLTAHRKELRSLSPQILLVFHNEIFSSFFHFSSGELKHRRNEVLCTATLFLSFLLSEWKSLLVASSA